MNGHIKAYIFLEKFNPPVYCCKFNVAEIQCGNSFNKFYVILLKYGTISFDLHNKKCNFPIKKWNASLHNIIFTGNVHCKVYQYIKIQYKLKFNSKFNLPISYFVCYAELRLTKRKKIKLRDFI